MISRWTHCQSVVDNMQKGKYHFSAATALWSLTLFEWLEATFLPSSALTDRSLYEFRRPDLFLIYHLRGNLHIKHLSPCLKQPGLQLPPRSVHTHRHTNPHIHTDAHTHTELSRHAACRCSRWSKPMFEVRPLGICGFQDPRFQSALPNSIPTWCLGQGNFIDVGNINIHFVFVFPKYEIIDYSMRCYK